MADSVGKGFPTTNIHRGHVFCDLDDLTYWKYVSGDPRLVSSWVLINGILQTQPDTSLWGINQAGAMWFYAPEQAYYGWDGSAILMMAFVGGENQYRYQNTIMVQDDFSFGGNASGVAGNLGWSLGAGTINGQQAEPNAPGIFRLGTSAVINTIARLLFNGAANLFLTFPQSYVSICRLNNNDTDTTVRIGYLNSTGGNPPDHGAYFEKLTTDTNWFCVVRISAGGPSRVDSLVNVNIGFNKFEIVITTTDAKFYINNQLVATIITAMTTVSVSPCYQIINAIGADKTLDIDYFHLVMTGLTR